MAKSLPLLRPGPLLVLLATGCVADRRIALEAVGAAPLPLEAVVSDLGAPPFALYVLDERREPLIVGEVRGLWRMRVARVESESDVVLWVREALSAALFRRGAEVLLPGEAVPTEAELEVRLERVFCTALHGYRAEVRLRAVARVGERVLLRRAVVGTGSAPAGPDGGGSVQAACLQDALRNAAETLADELAAELRARQAP